MCSEQKESRINIDKVREAIEQVADDFRNIGKNGETIFTEHDLQWRICHYLQHDKDINRKECWDPDDEYLIHTEIIWYKSEENKQSIPVKKCKPDISLMHEEDIFIVKNDKVRYKFDNIKHKTIVMELKFLGINDKLWYSKIKKDIQKIIDLRDINMSNGKNHIYFFIIVFYPFEKDKEREERVSKSIEDNLQGLQKGEEYEVVFVALPKEES